MAFGQSIRFAKAFVEVGLDATEAQRNLRTFRNQIKSFRRIGVGVGAGISAAVGPIAGLFAKATVEAAKFNETLSKFNVVFGKLAPNMRRFVDEMTTSLGQSRKQMLQFTSEFQDLLVPLGGAPEKAAEMSKQLTRLAVDLGSFNNRNTADVFNDLTSALTGSSETMKKYGVIANETAVKQELLRQGMDPKRATEFEKAVARVNIIMRSTTAAQGDALRTSDSLMNRWKAQENTIRNSLVEIGNELIPLANRGLQIMEQHSKDILDNFVALAKVMNDIGLATTGGRGAQGPGAGTSRADAVFGGATQKEQARLGLLLREQAAREAGGLTSLMSSAIKLMPVYHALEKRQGGGRLTAFMSDAAKPNEIW